MLPTQLENFLFGLALQRMGVGALIHPDQASPDFAGVLADMLTNDKYAVGARAFAERYPDTAVGTIAGQVVARIEALAAGHQKRCK